MAGTYKSSWLRAAPGECARAGALSMQASAFGEQAVAQQARDKLGAPLRHRGARHAAQRPANDGAL